MAQFIGPHINYTGKVLNHAYTSASVDYGVYTCLETGTFTIKTAISCSVLIVGAGGGGGSGLGGGAGGGGVFYKDGHGMSAGKYTVTVGQGGAGGTGKGAGVQGGSTIFDGVTATGGAGGNGREAFGSYTNPANSGGSSSDNTGGRQALPGNRLPSYQDEEDGPGQGKAEGHRGRAYH